MRVPSDVLKSVVFLCVPDGHGGYAYSGTAFLVGVASKTRHGQSWPYLVTARHCVEMALRGGRQLHVRMNMKDGGSYIAPAAHDEWFFAENEASDVAVTPIELDSQVVDFKFTPVEEAATRDYVERNRIGPGDDLVVVGLFTRHYGNRQNLPIVRSGTLASLPHEPMQDSAGRSYDAYLAEVRSIGGLSGSPVFVVIPGERVSLLGIIHGHWDVKRRAGAPISFTEPELEAVNMGIAEVTPIDALIEALDRPELVAMRRRWDGQLDPRSPDVVKP